MKIGDKFIYDSEKDFKIEHHIGDTKAIPVGIIKQQIKANSQYEIINILEFGGVSGIWKRCYFKNLTDLNSNQKGDEEFEFWLEMESVEKIKNLKRISEYRETRLNKILK